LKRELKKQIREDELVSGVEHAWAYYQAHKKEVTTTAAIVAALVLGYWGFTTWQDRQIHAAEVAFADALQIFAAPVVNELPAGTPPPAGALATSAEKYKKATAAFDGVERAYPATSIALRARYMSAICRSEAGDLAEARRLLTEIGQRTDKARVEPALARLALADVLRRSGETDKAVDAFRRIVDDSASPLPRDHALMSLAGTLEDAHRYAEARASYQRLVNEFPGSVYASEARRRSEYLETAGG
jgi:hypothetical protein